MIRDDMDLQTFLTNILKFIDGTIVPFLLAIAFLVFIWNATRFFIFAGGDEKEHEKAKSLALWSISAFVVIVSLWGIVNLLVTGFGLGGSDSVTPDYMGIKNGGSGGRYIPPDP